MLAGRTLLIATLVIGTNCKCDHEWDTFRDVNLVISQGMTAGNYAHNKPAYIAQGQNSKGVIVPGRLQLDNPKGLFHVNNMRVERTTNSVEFLRKNPNLNYTWVDAESNKCINNAVTVEDEFYIGRVLDDDFVYIGQVKIGDRGIRYENDRGYAVYTNDYEILTCAEIPTKQIDEECEGHLKSCEIDLRNLAESANNSRINLEAQEKSLKVCEELTGELRFSNELLKKALRNAEKHCNCDDIDIRSSTICPTQAPAPCPNQPREVQNLRNEITQLRNQLDEANRKLANGARGYAELESKNKQLVEDLNTATERVNKCDEVLTVTKRDEAALRSENQRLKAQIISTPSCTGVRGCVDALRSVRELTEAEQRQLLEIIQSKLSEEDLEKLNLATEHTE